MRNIIFTILAFAALSSVAQVPQGYFHYAPFMDLDKETYLETYLAIAGNSVIYKEIKDEKQQASVEVTMVFKNADIVKAYRKFNLKSSELELDAKEKPAFIHLERFSLDNGTYNFELTLKDNNADSLKFTYKDIITIDIDENDLSFSGIMLAESITPTNKRNRYSKSGFDIVPYVSNFYPDETNKLSFYMEVYNMDEAVGRDSAFIINTYLEGNPTKRLYTQFANRERKTAAPINVIMKSFDITKLNSGNYDLTVELRNKQNEVVGKTSKFIQRSNKEHFKLDVDYQNIDVSKTFAHKIDNFAELSNHIYALYPIAGRMEQKFILQEFSKNQLKLMQQFFYNFWKERNPANPEGEWLAYKEKLKLVQKHFGYGQRQGFTTDLGRIYLKYGPPSSIKKDQLGQNSIVDAGEGAAIVDAAEYQIWHYYKVAGQTDRIFVFVKGLSDMSLGTEYVLLYTDVTGEISYDDGLNFTSMGGLLRSIDSKMLQDIQTESSRALSRFLSGNR